MDFMHWLYTGYILPRLEAQASKDPIAFTFPCLENHLDPDCHQDLHQAKEFWATRAFLLGLRLGQGLSDASGLRQ